MRHNLENNGIGWATWDYKGGFGIADREGRRKQELIDILLSPLSSRLEDGSTASLSRQ